MRSLLSVPLTQFIQYDTPCISKLQDLNFSYGRIVFHCVSVPQTLLFNPKGLPTWIAVFGCQRFNPESPTCKSNVLELS